MDIQSTYNKQEWTYNKDYIKNDKNFKKFFNSTAMHYIYIYGSIYVLIIYKIKGSKFITQLFYLNK